MSFSLCFVTDRLSLTPASQDREGNIIVQEVVRAAERFIDSNTGFTKGSRLYLEGYLKAIQVFIYEMGIKTVPPHRVAVRVQ